VNQREGRDREEQLRRGGSATFAREWLAAADEACEEKRPIEFALSWAR